jgi:hypothetical protein
MILLLSLFSLFSEVFSISSNFSIAYITAIFGDYEKSTKYRGCRQKIKSDFICFTDNKNLINNGWELDFTPYHSLFTSKIDLGFQRNSLKQNNHTFNIAKYYKQSFQSIPRLKDYDIVVWVDASVKMGDANCHMSLWY